MGIELSALLASVGNEVFFAVSERHGGGGGGGGLYLEMLFNFIHNQMQGLGMENAVVFFSFWVWGICLFFPRGREDLRRV